MDKLNYEIKTSKSIEECRNSKINVEQIGIQVEKKFRSKMSLPAWLGIGFRFCRLKESNVQIQCIQSWKNPFEFLQDWMIKLVSVIDWNNEFIFILIFAVEQKLANSNCIFKCHF